MKLVLINPRFPESFWSFSWVLDKIAPEIKTVNSPLGLATLAALSPSDWEVTIIDENVEAIDWSLEADIVGVCGMGVQIPRQKEILKHFRERGIYTVVGGSYASLCPEDYRDHADTVVSGEAERIWPEFCEDFRKGQSQKLYRETGEIDLSISPVPRYDLLKLDNYQKVSLQFSRGCPFQCEFCDIIVMFGRKPRTKPLEQVGAELDLLREQGVTSVFFVDDNLIGHLPNAKKLLAYLVEYQEKHQYQFSFGTEASLNMASDQQLMTLFKKANFEWVFIGIETPNEDSLQETNKSQNLRGDLQTSIRTIYSYGIDIFAGFIVGFDSDDKSIFEKQYQFVLDSGIAMAMVGLLQAIPKTPLYERLAKSNRLREFCSQDNSRPTTNVIPLQTTYDELIEGYQEILRKLLKDKSIYQRLVNKLRYLKDPLVSPQLSMGRKIIYALRFLWRGILPGGPVRYYYFIRSLLLTLRSPSLMPVVLTDWIETISLKSFANRFLDQTIPRTEGVLQSLNKKLLRRIAEPLQRGIIALKIAIFQDRPHIMVDVKEPLSRRAIGVLGRTLRNTLRRSGETVVLDFHEFKTSQADQIGVLLKRLRRYHRQIRIQLTETLYWRLRDELAVFQYSLVPVGT